MGKNIFLKHFQNNFKEALEDALLDFKQTELKVIQEYSDLSGKFNGYIDIVITNEDDDTSIIAIEIEHISSYEQAKRNIEKAKTWAHNSNYRSCSLLHIFNEEECKIGPKQMINLVRLAKLNEKNGLGFYYDFIFYNVEDHRETKSIAHSLVNTKEFRTRLLMLMEHAEII